MIASHTLPSTPSQAVLFLAFELGWTEWKLGCSTGLAGTPRVRTIRARDLHTLWHEVARAKKRFGLSDDAGVYSCYEAGRDGFWLHRCLLAHGIHNSVLGDNCSGSMTRRLASDAEEEPSPLHFPPRGDVLRSFGAAGHLCAA